ncbi:MAG: anaerobic ribonucleoside-triphosphate reductase activating protein [Bifidobacteriaceae bacterium]|nr:anaerobic ribonucleoside-triphosphate reductase activating protein [Bifidobacteriaceae bacterium]
MNAAGLAIAGLAKLSTCDWPGRLVATVFLQGCPWRCAYCQNPGLIDCRQAGQVAWSEVVELMGRRRGLLDGIVLSGGEPTRQLGLADAARQVRAAGFGVGLHTAGPYPDRLEALLGLVDWVGLDIKALPERYAAATGAAGAGAKAFDSLGRLVASGVDHEVRVTVDPLFHSEAHVRSLVARLEAAGAKRVVLQEARGQGARPRYAAALGSLRLSDVIAPAPAGVEVRRAA